MKLYSKLSTIGFLKNSYVNKFLFVTFLGIHIPLIGLLFFVLLGKNHSSNNAIIVFILLMTLFATALTLLTLKRLIKPIEVASRALDEYRINRTVSQLPTTFDDEAGLLLRNIQKSISDNEEYRSDKEDLVYLLSHDLRNFAGNAQALAKLILDEKPSQEVVEYANLIDQTTSQQFVFIETFIKLIQEEDEISKKIQVVKDIKIKTLLGIVNDQVGQKLAAKGIQMLTNVTVKKAKLKIDQDLLIRVLVNLIDNAIKFSFPDSEIKISVTTKNNELIFEVSDAGIGFDSKYSEALFKKFTNQGRLGTANESSTGIGLYLCKKIVEKHEGKLFAKSEGVNKGASFFVIFENIN